MLKADKLPAAEDLGFVGEIREVNTKIVEDAIASGYTPVISTVAAGYHGEVYNINADVAAARIAAELGARKLILMTDIVGLLRDKDDENTLIPVVNVSDVPKLKRDGIISGGMIPKIDCCVEAVRRGVERAHIIDGRTPHSILVELFTDEGHRHDVLLRGKTAPVPVNENGEWEKHWGSSAIVSVWKTSTDMFSTGYRRYCGNKRNFEYEF